MDTVKVATFNLFNRMGEWGHRAPLVVDQFEDLRPDVIALQEVDLVLDQAIWLATQINRRVYEHGDRYLVKHVTDPEERASFHAIATVTRLLPEEHEMLDLMTFDRVAQRLVFRCGTRPFAFVATHLHYPPEAQQERVEQVERIFAWLDRDTRGLPTVLVGDFNAYAEPAEPVTLLLKSRFRSAYETVHGREPEKTWTTPVNRYDPAPHGTLDYVFVSEEFTVVDAGLAFDLPAASDPDLYPSDHLGVYAVLGLDGASREERRP